MKTLILLVVVVGCGFAGWVIWRRTRRRKHDPVGYFSGWDGYGQLRIVSGALRR